MHWEERYAKKRTTLEGAIRRIPKGKHIFVSSGASEPIPLVEELVRQASRFADNDVVHLLTLGPAPYVAPEYQDNFRHNAFFIGPNTRDAVHEGRADYTPVFLSQIPELIHARRMPVDVALIQVSPPDEFGFVNLGVAVDVVLAAVENARLVIAQVNPKMPVVYGSGFIPMDRIDAWMLDERPLPEAPPEPLDEVALEIGRLVASLVEDGSTLQMGIGQIPDAVLKGLTHRKDLGVWTEMFSDGVIDLIENGNINGKYKTIHPHKVSSSFTFGSERLYRYVDRNPTFTFHPSNFMNNPMNIARQHKMVAINSALQIDLTGQVCADSIGTKFYSGIGGQVDFIRGSSMCPGGKPIIAFRSTARNGTLSRIVANLDRGAGVVTSRGDVHYVVTEYGVADLLGKSIRERAMSLIEIAHPSFRGQLLASAKQRRYVFSDQIAPRAEYPRRYEERLESEDGETLLLRPIKVTDEEKITDFFYSLSDRTIYQRWMRAVQAIPHRERLGYLKVDYKLNNAFVLELEREGSESEIIGVSRYHTDPASNLAEVAFVIRDEWQGKNLGDRMLERMVEVAAENGVDGFVAEVLQSNQAMMRVFYDSGLEVQATLSSGVYSVRMPLPRRAPKARARSEDATA